LCDQKIAASYGLSIGNAAGLRLWSRPSPRRDALTLATALKSVRPFQGGGRGVKEKPFEFGDFGTKGRLALA